MKGFIVPRWQEIRFQSVCLCSWHLKMVAWSLSSTFIPAKLLPCYFTNLFIESGESKVNLLVIVFYLCCIFFFLNLCCILFKIYLLLAELDLRCFAQAFSSWGEQ